MDLFKYKLIKFNSVAFRYKSELKICLQSQNTWHFKIHYFNNSKKVNQMDSMQATGVTFSTDVSARKKPSSFAPSKRAATVYGGKNTATHKKYYNNQKPNALFHASSDVNAQAQAVF